MRPLTFRVRRGVSYNFSYDSEGGLTALPASDGKVRVIGGQVDLKGTTDESEEWSDLEDATGNNLQISDGDELYAGAGFGDPLVDGQVDDAAWGIGHQWRRPNGNLLEIGSGPGFLLESLQKHLAGWRLIGIDPSPISCKQAQARGIDCREGFLDTVELDCTFDAIVIMGNFQLHPDPLETLRQAASLANANATLYLDSKNPCSTARRIAGRAAATKLLGSIGAVQSFAAHSFHGIRNAPSRLQLVEMLRESGWKVGAVRTTAPRLLRFKNSHALAKGPKRAVWRLLDQIDAVRNERAWIQVSATRI